MENGTGRNNLREQLLREARESIKGIEERDDVLAAILTGSAAWGAPNPDGDLDILLFTRDQRGVVYRYFIPKFCSVTRRTEHGFIPHATAVQNIAKGYGTLISCSLIEQLKNGRVLFQRASHGDNLVESSRKAQPGALVIGTLINGIKETLGELQEHIDRERFAEAALATRRIIQLSVRALLLARERVGVAKEKHEYRAVAKHLKESEVERYRRLMNVEHISEYDSRRTIEGTADLMKWVLEQYDLSPALVNYVTK